MATRWKEHDADLLVGPYTPGASVVSAGGVLTGDGTSTDLRFELEFLDAGDVVVQTFLGNTVTPGAGVNATSKVEGVLVPASAVKARGYAVNLTDLGNPVGQRWMLNAGPRLLPFRALKYELDFDDADTITDGAAKRVTTHEEADQATQPSQNLLGPDAGPEKVGAQYLTGEAHSAGATLAELGLKAGDILSWRGQAQAAAGNDNNARLRMTAFDAGNAIVEEAETNHVDGAGADVWQDMVREAWTIPDTTDWLRLESTQSTSAGNLTFRRAMLNRGPLALPFGPALTAAAITKTLIFHAAEAIPVTSDTIWSVSGHVSIAPGKINVGLQEFALPIVLPKGVRLTKIRTRLYAETASEVADSELWRHDDEAGIPVLLASMHAAQLATWHWVEDTLQEVVQQEDAYVVVFGLDAHAQGAGFGAQAGRVEITYEMATYDQSY